MQPARLYQADRPRIAGINKSRKACSFATMVALILAATILWTLLGNFQVRVSYSYLLFVILSQHVAEQKQQLLTS